MTILHEARRLAAAGLPLLPNDPIEKFPVGHTGWERRTFTLADIEAHVEDGGALGVRMGDDRETIDLDAKNWIGDDRDELRRLFEELVEGTAPGLLDRLLIESTPTNGIHYGYRCAVIGGNMKLAERLPTDAELQKKPRLRTVVLIETRGNGGQVQIAPSPGYTLIQGDWANLPEITPEERDILLACARALSQVARHSAEPIRATRSSDGERPGDHYNSNGGQEEALQLLESDGWTVARARGNVAYLTRPGGTRGHTHATYGAIAPGVFYPFTSNCSPFDQETAYSPFAVLATLQHNGDYKAAARTLAQRYGMNKGKPANASAARLDTALAATEDTAPVLGPTAALAAALRDAGYHCVLNTETDEITINDEPLTDISYALLRGQVRDRRLGPVGSILTEAVTLQAKENQRAPIHDGLNDLTWDGESHVARLAACLHTAEDDVITYADGTTRRTAEVFLTRWLLGAVGRVFNREQNVMLVLDGPQDVGKSSLARWLGSVLPGVFCEEQPGPADKDSLLRLTKTLVWEAGELDATTRKHDVSALKHFLTRGNVTARRAYGRFDVTKPVLASFIGTVNSAGNGFLADPTGNRRFLVVALKGIEWSYQQLDVQQVWAEVVARYRNGERGRLLPEEAAYRNRINAEQHQTTGLMDDWLAMYFTLTNNPNDLMTSGEIAAYLTGKGVTLGGGDRAQAMSIAEALTRAGIGRADRRASIRRYGDARRAWIGIAPNYAGSDPTSGHDPTSIQPRAKVGSSQQYATNSPVIQPIQPQYTQNLENTHSHQEGAALAPECEGFADSVGSVGSVGSDSTDGASERRDPTSGKGWIKPAVRLDQVAPASDIAAEVARDMAARLKTLTGGRS